MKASAKSQSGITLIELVISIVVVGAGLAGVLTLFSQSTARSVDPMLAAQAHSIARGYLEEILVREFTDPDGTEVGESRPTFDDVDDYHGLAANGCVSTTPACPVLGGCACDQLGVPIAGLTDYQISVQVLSEILNGANTLRADVTVTHARIADLNVSLSGYRGDF